MTAADEAKKHIGCLILAAGGSTRLGRPKQLVRFEGLTLIRRAAERLSQTDYSPVIVVLGSHADETAAEVSDLPIQTVTNADWQQGMSTSITTGLKHLIDIQPDTAAVLITLCDQPLITAEDLTRFTTEFRRTSAPIIAAEYNQTTGVPALFARSLFPELLRLTGDKGARSLIRQNPQTLTIPLPNAAPDIDTPNDLAKARTK